MEWAAVGEFRNEGERIGDGFIHGDSKTYFWSGCLPARIVEL
jgi:hypothetical protein